MRVLQCLRCHSKMTFLKRENIQLGRTGTILGDWSNILAGALDAEIYSCPNCGKIEFFMPGFQLDDPDREWEEKDLPPEVDAGIVGVSMDGVPQVRCPSCGQHHDFDYPQCIYCGHKY